MKPTREQVLQWMHQAANDYVEGWPENVIQDFETFAAIVYAAGAAAAMKERAAKVCEAESSDPAMPEAYSNNHMGGWADGCDACAAAIRALGDDE